MKTVAVFGTLDSKGAELGCLSDQLRELGVATIIVDLGVMREPPIPVDVSAAEVAAAAGLELEQARAMDRATCIDRMAQGAAAIISTLCRDGRIDGAVSMGGGQGSYAAGVVLRALPVGFPKLLISTLATLPHGQSAFAGINDTLVMQSLVDVAGLNDILRMVIRQAAAAMYGLLQYGGDISSVKSARKRVGVTMWGVTTPCVDALKRLLEARGIDTYVFHSNGMGGAIMESFVQVGFFDAVADLTVPEVTTGVLAGCYPENEKRMRTAGRLGIPQLVSVGGVDMLNMMQSADQPIPARYAGRKIYVHNRNTTFARSTPEENERFGAQLAERLNAAKGPVTVLLPLGGTSTVNADGGVFRDREADEALFRALRERCGDNITIIDVNCHINDPAFARLAADILGRWLQ